MIQSKSEVEPGALVVPKSTYCWSASIEDLTLNESEIRKGVLDFMDFGKRFRMFTESRNSGLM